MDVPSSPYCRLDLIPSLADRFVFGVAPIDYGPAVLLRPFGFHLAVDTLPSPTHAGASEELPPLSWIWFPPSENQRDFNPPDPCAAQRTLRTSPTAIPPYRFLASSTCQRLVENEMALPGSDACCSTPCHGLRPRHIGSASPWRPLLFWLPENETLGPVQR